MMKVRIEGVVWVLLMASFAGLAGQAFLHRAELKAYADGQSKEVLLERVRLLEQEQNAPEARAILERLVWRYYASADVLLAMARHCDGLNDTEQAQTYYRRAADLGPHPLNAMAAYAGFFDARGESEAAEAAYRSYLQRYPEDAQAQLALGRRLLARGDAETALPHLESAISSSVVRVDACLAAGEAAMALGRSADAIAMWTAVATGDNGPQGAVLWQDIAGAREKSGHWPQAVAAWESYLARFPNSLNGWRGLLRCATQCGGKEAAERASRRIALMMETFGKYGTPLSCSPFLDAEAWVVREIPAASGKAWAVDLLLSVRRNCVAPADLSIAFWVMPSAGEMVPLRTEPSVVQSPPQWRGDSFRQQFFVRAEQPIPAGGGCLALSPADGSVKLPLPGIEVRP